MSVDMEQAADAILQAAGHISSQDELSDVEMDGDGSSSLSDIEDKDPDQDEDGELSDELSNPSDEDNDSEAETERLEESPNKFRPHKDVVLNAHNDSQIYERSPSKLNNQVAANDLEEEEDDDPLSDDDLSLNESPESPKSSVHEDPEPEIATVPTSMEASSVESRTLLSVADGDSRKRKRSIMAGSGLDEDVDEPVSKRIGSIMAPADDYAIEDENNLEEDVEQSNPNSGNISDEEGGDAQEEEPQEEPTLAEDDQPEVPNAPPSPKRRGRKKKKVVENGIHIRVDLDHAVESTDLNDDEIPNGEEEAAEAEVEDEADAQTKNEEELEKKRIALDQLGAIEKQFATFRDRLYEDRLEQLNREEAMLRQAKPTHPEYLAMMQCIDARRDERIRVAHKTREYGLQTLRIFAVSTRSQILSQYQQEVREARELQLEQLGKQWYEIQHDRRSYAGSVPDYTLKFPTRRSQQIHNQVAYSNEVSILSGIAKHVGFPAAPPMLPASAAEMEEDFEKMGRAKPVQQTASAMPFAELAALRSAGSTSRFKPAEEQFIEQTPWANPQHPSHAHLIQRQSSAQQAPRTTSPFSQVQVPPRRHSHHQAGPIQGTFSNPTGRISPHNPFTNSHTIAPSPLGSRQTSLSPQLSRPPASVADIPMNLGIPHSQQPRPREFPKEVRREQATAIMGQF